MTRPRSLDLIGAAAVALLTLAVAFSGARNPAEQDGLPLWFLPFGALMALFLPGYAVSRALLPQQDHSMRLLLSLGISIALSILGGLVLHYLPWGLSTAAWAVWLSGVTLLGCLCALLCRDRLHADRSPLPRMDGKTLLSLLGSAALVAGAIWLARDSALHAGTAFTQLWAVPGIEDGQYILRIGVRNQEVVPYSYEVYVESRGRALQQWPAVRLEDGQTWEQTLVLGDRPTEIVTVLLFREDAPQRIYRTARVTPATFEALLPGPPAP